MSAALTLAAGAFRPLRRVLSPPSCEACASPVLHYDSLCSPCEDSLESLQEGCSVCALPLTGGLTEHRCLECISSPPAFDRVTAAWIFSGPVEQAIRAAKFGKYPGGMALLARRSSAIFADCVKNFRPDFLLPVPIPYFRNFLRGYNQSTLLLEAWKRETGIRIPELTGMRRRWSRPQARQDRAARLQALRRAMSYRGPGLHGKRVLAVDDVLTTGSTAEQLSRILKNAGAQGVEVMVLARVPKNQRKPVPR